MIDSNPVVGSGELVTAPAADALASFPPLRSVAFAVDYARVAALALVVALALLVRLDALGASGFSEDEINKLHAVEAYARLDFTANAEHPMVMKLADWGSMSLARWWNSHDDLAAIGTISSEAALRLPNALIGAATTLVIVLLAEALFDATAGLWAGVFWAIDVNAAAINRIGKEDTFLLFFFLLAAYWYERAKQVAPDRPQARDRWFRASGAGFGLMLASKYMPQYLGLHALFNLAADRRPLDDVPDKRPPFYLAMGAAFLAVNFGLLLPANWRYLAAYIHGDMQLHSGYDFAHRIYVNTVDATPWGLPPTFYAAFFASKVSLGILAAAALGVVWAIRHSDTRGATFLRVFLLFTLVPYSLAASKFLRYMLPVLAIVDIAAGVGAAWLFARIEAVTNRPMRDVLAAFGAALLVIPPVAQQITSAPFYGLAQNAVGARLVERGSLFPDDEFYDAGVREAVQAIAIAASSGAVVCSDATSVVAEYLARDRRGDIRSCSIAHDGLPNAPTETWVIVQPGHIYFENAEVIAQVRRRPQWLDVPIGGVSAVQVYRWR